MARTADPALPGKLLQAAREVFASKGYIDARMNDIAACAGVAVGTIYLHFKTKEDLVGALCRESYRRVGASVLPALNRTDLREALDAAVDAAFDCYAEEKDILRLLYLNMGFGEALKLIGMNTPDELAQPFIKRLIAGIDAGVVRRYENLQILLDMISTAFDQAALMHYVFGQGDLDAYKRTLKMFIKGAVLFDDNS